MKKVLHVMSSLNTGGVEMMVYNLYKNMDKDKFRFDFIVHGNNIGMLEEKFEQMGSKIYHITPKKESLYKNLIEMYKIIGDRNDEYDIIHCHQNIKSIIPIYIAKRIGIKKRIVHSHTSNNYFIGVKKYLNKFILKMIKKYASDYIACSKKSQEALFINSIFKDKHVYMLNNGLDIEKYKYNEKIRKKVRKNIGIKDELTLIQIARFSKEKNQIFTIELFEQVVKKRKNVKLLFVGDGELEDSINKEVINRGLSSKVIFLGVRKDIHEILQAVDILLLPSLNEGLGMVLIEAQAASVRCIASTNVPIESKITKLLSFNDLNNIDKWISDIISYSKADKLIINNEVISKKGYDANECSKILELIYES